MLSKQCPVTHQDDASRRRCRDATPGVVLQANCQNVVNPLADVGRWLPHEVQSENYGYFADPEEISSWEGGVEGARGLQFAINGFDAILDPQLRRSLSSCMSIFRQALRELFALDHCKRTVGSAGAHLAKGSRDARQPAAHGRFVT
jgi:hypothetical protein